MSMREYPTSGYVVPVDQLCEFFPGNDSLLMYELFDEGDIDKITDFINNHLPLTFPNCSTVFRPTAVDTIDEPMKRGVWYAVFDEDDLYIPRQLNAAGEVLKKAGIEPHLAHWSTWG